MILAVRSSDTGMAPSGSTERSAPPKHARQRRPHQHQGHEDQKRHSKKPASDVCDGEGRPGQKSTPEVHEQNRSAVAVADLQELVVDVLLVRSSYGTTATYASNDGEDHVGERHREDEQGDGHGDGQRRKFGVGGLNGPPHTRDGGG